MPCNEPDPDDPHALMGVKIPAGGHSHEEMAYAFAEEFARLGFDRHHLLVLFRSPQFRAANLTLRALGEERISQIIGEATAVWGRFRTVVTAPLVQLEGRCTASEDALERGDA